MLTRRALFSFGGMGSLGVMAPLAASQLFDPGRRVTHLHGGGSLIEDETFSAGIALYNVRNCSITGNNITVPEGAPGIVICSETY